MLHRMGSLLMSFAAQVGEIQRSFSRWSVNATFRTTRFLIGLFPDYEEAERFCQMYPLQQPAPVPSVACAHMLYASRLS